MTPTLEQITPWLVFASYAVTAILALGIGLLARHHLPYFPALVVVVTTQGAKAFYFGVASWPLLAPDQRAWLRMPGMEFGVQLFILGGLVWTLILVGLQNKADTLGQVDIDGRIRWHTPAWRHREAVRAMESLQRTDPPHPDRPSPAQAEQRVNGGLAALAKFRRERQQRGLG